MTPHVLIVAGSDSSGGAGIARDVETVSTFGLRSCLAITAVTVQTHATVERIEQMPPELMVEIEIGVLNGQCLDRRIDDATRLISEIAAWERQRNAAGAQINWMFTTEKARAKMGRAYPQTVKESEPL